MFEYDNADGGIRTPERSCAPAFKVITFTFEAGVLPARLHLLLKMNLNWISSERYKFFSNIMFDWK